MLLKAVVPIVTAPVVTATSGLLGIQGNTNIAKSSKQLIEWYKEIIA